MIFLNQKEEPVIHINPDLVINYKRQGDRLLVEIRRTLTKQLVFYGLYADLQLVNNAFFSVIDNLLNEVYRDQYEIHKGQQEFEKTCNMFIKNCDGIIDDNVYEHVVECLDDLKLVIQKIVYISENICLEDK